MRQQINLYQPVFSKERRPLSARIVGASFAALIVALTAYAFYAQSKVSSLSAEIDALRTQQTDQQAALEAPPALGKPELTELKASIASLEHKLEERRNALQVLQSGAAGQPIGFAARMEALAKRHIEGLWIDKLVLSGTNGSMSLSGATLDADLVPAYLRNLALESVLSGARFDEFVIERPLAATSTSATSDEEGEVAVRQRKSAQSEPIRFRAGNKALTAEPSEPEAST